MVLGTEATEWNSMAADEQDASLAEKRLNEDSEFAGHVEAVAQLHLDSRKSEALWLMTSKSIARSLDSDAKVVNSKKMKPLAETLEAKTKCICEKLLERALGDDDWTSRAVTSQLETSFVITVKKTKAQADRIEKSLAGKQKDTRCESETTKLEMWDGALNVEDEDRTETMTGPFKWDLVNASKGNGQGVGATWTETAPEQGMLDEEWRTAARRRLRLKTEESKMWQCGMFKDEKR